MIRIAQFFPPGHVLVQSMQTCAHCGEATPILRILGPHAAIPPDHLLFYPRPGENVRFTPTFARYLRSRYPFFRQTTDDTMENLVWANLCVRCDKAVSRERLEDLSDLAEVGLDAMLAIEDEDGGLPLVHGQCSRAALEPLIEGGMRYVD